MSPGDSFPTVSNAAPPLRVICVEAPGDGPAWAAVSRVLPHSPWGPFVVERCADQASAARRLAEVQVDALLALQPPVAWPGLAQAALNAAVVLVAADESPEHALRWLAQGVEDVLPAQALQQAEVLGRSLRLAIERKRLEREARKAYATDLATGLPNHAQLVEHMSHLLALREREPAPMGLLVLRLEGLATTEVRLGRESANVLRRKVAVRLRAGVRASDVVASLGIDAFGVLLSAIEEPLHGHRVAQKLVTALQQPFSVAGMDVHLAISVGAALYPADGKHADELLRRASGSAAVTPAVGRAGILHQGELGGLQQAANDDDAP